MREKFLQTVSETYTWNCTTGNNIRRIGLAAGLILDTENIKSKIEEVCEKISFAEIPED